MRKAEEAGVLEPWPVADGEPGLVQHNGQILLMQSPQQIPAA